MDIVYVAYEGIITDPTFDSRVIDFLKQLQKNKEVKVTLIGFENITVFFIQNRRLKKKKYEIRQELKIRVDFYPRIPKWMGTYLGVLTLLIPLFRKVIRKKRIVFHARGSKSAFIGCKLKNVFPSLKVLYDARGILAEDYLYSLRLRGLRLTNRRRKILQKLKRIEQNVINHVDGILCFSNEFKKYYLRSYNVERKKIHVVPCGVDVTIFSFNRKVEDELREKMKLKNKLVFVYNGSMHSYQRPKAMVKLFKEFYKSNKEVFFLILTFEVEKMKKLLEYELIPWENYKVLNVEHRQVPMYLNAADIGILLREKNMFNRITCPTKFAEYIACGLYTIVTEEIGDISGMVERKKIGEVIKGSLLEKSEMKTVANKILAKRVEIQKKENKERIAHLAQKYSWRSLMTTFWKTYEDLFKKHDLR